MIWTVLNSVGEVVSPCVLSDVHPSDAASGYAWDATYAAVELSTEPDPAKHEWDGTAWVDSLSLAQERVWNVVKAKRAALESGSAPTPFGAALCDLASQSKINGLVSMAILSIQSGAAFSEQFTMTDNSVVTLNASQMIAMGLAVGGHISEVYAHARDLRDAIYAATSVAELAAIETETGWPV